MKYYLILILLIVAACSHKTTDTSAPKNVVLSEATYISDIPSRALDEDTLITRIAFGSCANQDEPAPLWRDIAAAKPDLFLFMGDNVYASSPTQQPIAEQYRKLDKVPDYVLLRAQVPFLATWDDHDFGKRDGGADWSGKDRALRDFRNYWQYTQNSLPPAQDGVYHSKIVGPPNKKVQVILLDTRYNRSPLKERAGMEGKAMDYEPQNDGTILGEAQWQWLEAQLKKKADIRFIVSSIQLVATEPKFEKWGNFAKERERFFKLRQVTRAKNIIVLSGDRHIASIARYQAPGVDPLYDITASSINRANHYPDSDKTYVGPVYNKENFGLAQIDWKKREVLIEIRGFNNEVVNQVKIALRK